MDQTQNPLAADGVAPSPEVLVQQLPDRESILLHLDREAYFGLDAIGTRFWEVLVDAPSVEAAYQRLLGEFDVEPEQLRRDLAAFLDKLRDRGLLEPVTP